MPKDAKTDVSFNKGTRAMQLSDLEILSQFQPTKQLFWCSLSIQPYTVFLPQALILRHFLIGSILSPDLPTLPDHTVYFLHIDKQTSPSHFCYSALFFINPFCCFKFIVVICDQVFVSKHRILLFIMI